MALNIIIDPAKDTQFYDSVRRLLGGLEEEVIPNETILDPAFYDLAEIEVLTLVPCIEGDELSFADKVKVRLAFIHLLAAKLCPTAKAQVDYEVKTIDVTWRRSPVKYDDLQDDLLGTVNSLLSGIECYAGSDSKLFAIAPSKRAVGER